MKKLKSKIEIFFLTLFMGASLVFGTSVDAWSGQGSGTASDPFIIWTKDDLIHFRDGVNDGTYNTVEKQNAKLMANIVLNESNQTTFEWEPIGKDVGHTFKGTFDGNGFRIVGLYINATTSEPENADYKGFFGIIDGATIENLEVKGNKINRARNYVGGIAGSAIGECTIRNCSTNISINARKYVGGIVGCVDNPATTIDNCFHKHGQISKTNEFEDVESPSSDIGGIAGYFEGTMTNCYNYGCDLAGDANIGGLAGHIVSSTKIHNCFSYDSNVYPSDSNSTITSLGNIVGYADSVGSHAFEKNYFFNWNDYSNYNGINSTSHTELIKLTNDQFKQKESFVGWDFEDTWTMGLWAPILRHNYDLSHGRGDLDYPFLISTKNQLIDFAYTVNIYYHDTYFHDSNDYCATLLNDIDLINGKTEYTKYYDWDPIGKGNYPYTGTFDGNGHKVINWKCTYNNNPSGFFSQGKECVIKDLTIEGGTIQNSKKYAGGIIGSLEGGQVHNCVNKMKEVICTSDSSAGSGGIVGHTSVQMYALNDPYVTISNCVNYSYVKGYKYVGGIAGHAIDNIKILDCVNHYDGEGTYGVENIAPKYPLTNYDGCGGIAGYCVASNYNSGNNTYPHTAYIERCYNDANIKGAYNYVAGIAGYSVKTNITDCYNTATVHGFTINGDGTHKGTCVGGIAGRIIDGTITNCFNYNDSEDHIIASSDVKEIAGYPQSTTVTNCYYLDSSYAKYDYNATKLTTEQFKNKESFGEDWTFDIVWALESTDVHPRFVDRNNPIEVIKALIATIWYGYSGGSLPLTAETKAKIDEATKAYNDYYNSLSHEDKTALEASLATELTNLQAAKDDIATQVANDSDITTVKDAISAIVTPITNPGSKESIEAARSAYESLTGDKEEKKLFVDNYDDLVLAENTLKALEVQELIAEITLPVTYTGSKDAIEAARSAYEELSDAQKQIVKDFTSDNYDKLVDAENTYKALETKSKIDAIGDVDQVSYPDSKEVLMEAKDYYDELTDAQKAKLEEIDSTLDDNLWLALEKYANSAIDGIPTNVTYPESKDIIFEAKDTYDSLTPTLQALISEENKEKLDNALKDLAEKAIQAIGEVSYTQECRTKINDAKNTISKLTPAQISTIDSEIMDLYVNSIYLYDVCRNLAVLSVEGKINDIGNPDYVYYPDSGEVISEAREAYDNDLFEEDKILVSNYSDLLTAEENYNASKLAAVNATIDEINNISDPVIYPDSGEDISSARSYYENLDDDQKALVSNYQKLVDAENEFAALETESLIDLIGEVEYDIDCKNRIDAARDSYNALNIDEKACVDQEHLTKLLDAEALLAQLIAEHPSQQNVIDKINAIGTVRYPYSGYAINAAKTAYDALDENEKGFILNYQVLVDAIDEYNTQKINGVTNVENLINQIGEVNYPESYGAIQKALNAYRALTSEQKELVSNYGTLQTALNQYKTLEDNYYANQVINLIDHIGDFEYSDSFKDLIDEAGYAYENLTPDQQALVTNLDLLIEAEIYYSNHDAANNVTNLVNNIGEVTLNDEVKANIDAARSAFDSLINEQSRILDNKVEATLKAAENRYAELVAAKAEADVIVTKIDAIGEVSYPNSYEAIQEARNAYEALTNEDIISFITNLDVLEAAESRYEELKVNGAKAVENLINDIGNVTYPNSNTKIQEALNAYNALTSEQKDLVKNYDALVNAINTYSNLEAAHNVDVLINNIGEVTYSDTCKANIDAARDAYNALTIEQKGLVNNYQILIDSETTYNNVKEVVDIINSIGEVELTEETKALIERAREMYEALNTKDKALITDNVYNRLNNSEIKYDILVRNNIASIVWGTIGITLGSLVLLCVFCYFALFYLFNKWIKKDKEAIRIFRLGNKDNKVRVLIIPVELIKVDGKTKLRFNPIKFEYYSNNEIFNTKIEALK